MGEWTRARKTGNAHLLLGHIGGLIDGESDRHNYKVEKLGDPLVVVNVMTKNRFIVEVKQIEGVE